MLTEEGLAVARRQTAGETDSREGRRQTPGLLELAGAGAKGEALSGEVGERCVTGDLESNVGRCRKAGVRADTTLAEGGDNLNLCRSNEDKRRSQDGEGSEG